MNDKAKSISILLLVSRDFVYVLFWNWQPEKRTFEGRSAKRKRREKKHKILWADLKAVEMRRHKLFLGDGLSLSNFSGGKRLENIDYF